MTGKKGMKRNQKRSQLYLKPLVENAINKEIDDEMAVEAELSQQGEVTKPWKTNQFMEMIPEPNRKKNKIGLIIKTTEIISLTDIMEGVNDDEGATNNLTATATKNRMGLQSVWWNRMPFFDQLRRFEACSSW